MNSTRPNVHVDMSRFLFLSRFRLRLVVFCIVVLLNVGVAFPRHSWISAGMRGERSLPIQTAARKNLSGTTPIDTTCNNNRVLPENPTKSSTLGSGGEDVSTTEKDLLQSYLQSLGPASTSLENFHVHGWRWHTRSLIREVGRLHNLASKTKLSNVKKLQEATEYVIDFNLRGLHKIEAGVFFPWMRQQLTSLPQDQEVSSAFASVIAKVNGDRVRVAELGRTILRNAAIAADASKSRQLRSGAIDAIVDHTLKLRDHASSMMELEDAFLVPAVAALVPDQEQKAFNNKVLRGLGLLDSRLHLVSMYEAVKEDKNHNEEQALFQKSIPSVPQMMIPRWKRKLYMPKTYMLE